MNKEIKEILDRLEGRKNWYLHQQKNNSPFNDEDYIAYMVLDYITNLQQKNEELKELVEIYKFRCFSYPDLKLRIDKAIEYIKQQNVYYGFCDDLLNILQNGSDEE